MAGMGTIVNVCAIIFGGFFGIKAGKLFSEKMQQNILHVCGIMTLFLGIGDVMSKMLVIKDGTISTQGTMMMIASLLIGTVIGTALKLSERVEQFGRWLKNRTHNEKDSSFVNAFVTASFTVCIGAMAIVGSIEDGIYANHAILYTKAVLDCIIVAAMAASLGPGAIFAALPVGILQGTITILARFAVPLLNDAAMSNLSYVGSIMIACVGINLLRPDTVDVADMLPGLLVAIVWAFLPL